MTAKIIFKSLTYCIATVWFINGFFCKVLNLVPRHKEIVSRILGTEHASFLAKVIGISEIFMAIWILTGIKSRLNAIIQILIITIMNTLEFILVPDILLWGKFNSLFALIFISIIFFNEFIVHKKLIRHT